MKRFFAFIFVCLLFGVFSNSANAAVTYWAVGAQQGKIATEVTITVLQLPNDTPPDVTLQTNNIFFSAGPYKTLAEAKAICELNVQMFINEMDIKVNNLCSKIRYK